MLGSPAGPGGTSQRGLWPLAPAPAPTAASFSAEGLSKYGVYSLFPGGPTFGSTLYSHASTIGRFASGHIQQSSGNTFHTAHKVSDSLFSTTGYTFGAPTPPPGSPYSPIPVAQLELLAKGFSNNIIIQQPPDFPSSPKKLQIMEKRCDEKCCSVQRKNCHCPSSPVKKIQEVTSSGCSRTNPIEWIGVNVKKEPGSNPCQVAEITTSVSPMVKVEIASPTQKTGCETIIGNSVISGNGAQIPVGIAVARQRVQHEVVASPSLPPAGLLATVNTGGAQIKEIDNAGAVASMAASSSGAGQGGGTLLQCADDRTTGLAAWSVGGNHSQAVATPTLWQYPAPVPMEPMVPLSVPTMPPVGFQLVRDPTTGGLLLLPTATGIEPLQQAVVWPSYPQQSSVLLPSLSSMPPPPLQLLSSASSDYLSSSTTLHQHTQTHSTRLVAVTTDTKRKIPLPIPATTLIKIETDGTLDQTKTLQAVSTIANNTGTMFTDQSVPPLVTTHVIYQHPTNLILSQTPNPAPESTPCRSQATSPVTACLTPPPDSVQITEEEPASTSTVQDASNQTDTPICSEDDNTTHTISDVIAEEKIKEIPDNDKIEAEVSTINQQVEESIPEPIQESQIFEMQAISENVSSSTTTLEKAEPSSDENTDITEEIATEADAKETPDLSGLELLSNSIVEYESCRKVSDEQIVEDSSQQSLEQSPSNSSSLETSDSSKPNEAVSTIPLSVDDNLGGLDLLCALAEQRIKEENIEKPLKEKSDKSKHRHQDRDRKREKRKSKKHYSEEPKRKKMKSDKRRSSEDRRNKEHRKKEKRHSLDKTEIDISEQPQCSCNFKHYKTPESEQEVKKFLESKSSHPCCKGEWPCMNAMELDMRIKLAELQREYKEKQKELSKLKPKKHSHHHDCAKKKSRKKSQHSEKSNTPPPELDKVDMLIRVRNPSELLKPPKLSFMPKLVDIHKRRHSEYDSSCEKLSSSKKRKVGRPKRHMSAGEVLATETIVAKKPKNNFVEFLLAAKEKLKTQNKEKGKMQIKEYTELTPPRYTEETYTHKLKRIKNNNNNIIDDIKSSKIRPKLKAEATIKAENDEDNNEWYSIEEEEAIDHIEEDIDDDLENEDTEGSTETSELLDESATITTEEMKEPTDEPCKISLEAEQHEEITDENKAHLEDMPNPCELKESHLEIDKLRVLTAMGGLFYAGQLNAIEPPDVYSITLDGERGNRPHIMSREEILRDAILEVSPKSTEDLPVGTRLCAYWSQQYRCLYPGSAAEPGTPDPHLDGKFVSVEFDDGDSGRIALNDIRLLPPNYPIMEYDPNPLLSLSKRKRRTSTSVSVEEKHPPEITKLLEKLVEEDEMVTKSTPDSTTLERHKEKKRLKKKKREKLKQELYEQEDKKKKKKHKCTDEFCKHKKHHKKHKKHKKHHDKSERSRTGSEVSSELIYTCEIVNDDESKSTEGEDSGIKDDIDLKDIDKFEDQPSKETINGDFPNYDEFANPEDEVTMDDILESEQTKKSKKFRNRQESCESRSKMSAFLPARQLWHWSGKGYKRQRAKGKSKKCFYKSIERGKESISVGDAAVFLSTGRPDRPYIGRIEAMWELCGTMVVKVKWFYHPEETVGCPMNLQYPGALFESPHVDENDVQTISHKCEVIPLKEYTEKLGDDPARYATIYDNNDIYYLAGYYDPTTTTLKMEPGIPFSKS